MLDNALDFDIKECEFWEMTLAEIERQIKSKQRLDKLRVKEKANFDYIMALLIGRAMARCFSESADFPQIHEVYPSIFADQVKEKEEDKQEKIDQLSALRFKQFAKSYNEKIKEVANDK
jgi:hypothetical protein